MYVKSLLHYWSKHKIYIPIKVKINNYINIIMNLTDYYEIHYCNGVLFPWIRIHTRQSQVKISHSQFFTIITESIAYVSFETISLII